MILANQLQTVKLCTSGCQVVAVPAFYLGNRWLAQVVLRQSIKFQWV